MQERYEIESLIISSLLSNREEFDDVVGFLSEEDFDDPNFKAIYKNIESGVTDYRAGTGISPLEFARLIVLNEFPSTIYALSDQLRKISTKQKLKLIVESATPDSLDKYLDNIIAVVEENRSKREEGIYSMTQLMSYAVDEIVGSLSGKDKLITTPFRNLNTTIGGLMQGRLITIAGRPATGKSAFALQIALSVARKNRKVMYVSLEMKEVELAMRVISSETGVSTIKMVNGSVTNDELEEISKSINRSKNDHLIITNKGRSISEIKQLLKSQKPDLLIIDSVNLMTAKGENERIRITSITRSLKQIAIQFDIPIIMLAQLNREAEGNYLPQLSEIKESGSLEEDSDIVMLLAEVKEEKDFDAINDAYKKNHDKYLLNPINGFEDVLKRDDRVIVCLVRKNRNGGTGRFVFLRDSKRYLFEELPKEVDYDSF